MLPTDCRWTKGCLKMPLRGPKERIDLLRENQTSEGQGSGPDRGAAAGLGRAAKPAHQEA